MKLALLSQAELTHDTLSDDIENGELWCEWHDYIFSAHVSPRVQQNFRTNKCLRQGFSNTFSLAASCLRSNIVPHMANVLKAFRDATEWPPVTKNYFERSGTSEGIQAVLETLFDMTKALDEKIGDGNPMTQELVKLKACRNDREFRFVARACGLSERNVALW
jgi:hypothetical protein